MSTNFLWDESRDLVNIHQIWVEKKLTLVGPISEDRSHTYSSLTYYLLLPFAALYNFDPLGLEVGAVFWGIVTALLFVWLVYKYNSDILILGAVVAAVWFPLVQTSRWAWNPNFLILWFILGLILTGYKNRLFRLAGGVALGMTLHHHYLSIIPLVMLVVKKRDILMLAGMVFAVLPFVIFDLRHPPGIFITRMIGYNRDTISQNMFTVITKIPGIFRFFFEYIFQIPLLALIGIIGSICLGVFDLLKKNSARSWLVFWVISLMPLALFAKQFWYLLPTIPFFMMWIISPRDQLGRKLSLSILVIMIIGSLITLPKLWWLPDWQGNLNISRGAIKIIEEQIKVQNLKNPNLAVLGSPDIYTNGNKFRNLLLVDNVRVRPYEEYGLSDNLFVITKSNPETLRRDPATELIDFKNGPVAGEWNIPETDWRVIQFNKY